MYTKITIALLVAIFSLASGECNYPYITQYALHSWTNGGQSYSLWQGHIHNPKNSDNLFRVYLNVPEDHLYQHWEIVRHSAGFFKLPEYVENNGISAGSNHTFGYIASSNDPVLITVNSYFCTPARQGTDCVCTAIYKPVCGVDGKTYGNSCVLGCAGVGFHKEGEC